MFPGVYVLGSGAVDLTFCVNRRASLYAGLLSCLLLGQLDVLICAVYESVNGWCVGV